MPVRNARPCRIMALWGNGGYVLGFVTALMGRQGIWVCTAAVESAVHRHLEDQLHFLRDRDAELHALVLAIQDEELSHLRHAEERIVAKSQWARALGGSSPGAPMSPSGFRPGALDEDGAGAGGGAIGTER